jgi:hypothetical protein
MRLRMGGFWPKPGERSVKPFTARSKLECLSLSTRVESREKVRFRAWPCLQILDKDESD